MPIYIDRHFVEGATRHTVAHAHEKDLKIQDKYRIQFITYWFDETRSTAFCLIDAPDKDSIQKAHNEAHGLVPHEIIEVDPTIVESFLGRIMDPEPVNATGEVQRDSAFRAIMFTDLLDSTLMTTRDGDSRALHMLHIHNAMTRKALREYQGNEIKHTGDGIMASFVSVPAAVECAVAIQKAFMDHNYASPDETLHLRIGLSAGEPIEEHGDFFGTAVQLAARLCDIAEPGQILAGQIVYDMCKENGLLFDDMGDKSLKGFSSTVRVYKIEMQAA
jgi:class 3 adenylate cyclase